MSEIAFECLASGVTTNSVAASGDVRIKDFIIIIQFTGNKIVGAAKSCFRSRPCKAHRCCRKASVNRCNRPAK